MINLTRELSLKQSTSLHFLVLNCDKICHSWHAHWIGEEQLDETWTLFWYGARASGFSIDGVGKAPWFQATIMAGILDYEQALGQIFELLVIWDGHVIDKDSPISLEVKLHKQRILETIAKVPRWRHQMETFSVLLALCAVIHQWIPLTKASDTELWCFFDLRLE